MTDAGFDDWLDAVDDGEGYYLRCPEGHGSLPPRHVCPHCGAADLDRTPLPETGTIVTYTVCHVGGPEFEAETPYATAIAEFGDVRLTGIVRGVDPEDVRVGASVEVSVETARETGEERLTLRPR